MSGAKGSVIWRATAAMFALALLSASVGPAVAAEKWDLYVYNPVSTVAAVKGLNTVIEQRGVVDGVLTASTGGGNIWKDLLKYNNRLGINYFNSVLIVNKERFAKLSPDIQGKVRRIVGDNMPLITKAMADDEDDLTRKFADGGITVTKEDPQDIEAGTKLIAPYWEEWARTHRPIIMATQREPVADGVASHAIENVIPGSTLVEDACESICALFLVVSIVLIAAEAIARNVFATSFQITDEVCGYLLVALTFLSMSVAEVHGAFHRVELVQTRLSFAARLISQMAFDFISLVASALVTWQLYRLAINSWRAEDVTPTPLQTPLWLPQSAMAIGMLLLCLALIRTTVTKARSLRRGGRS